MADGGLELRDVSGLPDSGLRPPVMAEAGDPFSALRVASLIARLPRGVPVSLRDVVERLNAEYLDWSFSRPVVAWVAVQMQANWLADFRSASGFQVDDGPLGEQLTIEDTARIEPWLIRQVERIHGECLERLRLFARDEGAIP
ncbi:MAG TPA: hypothetical protein VEX62_01180 [Candidatus Limnocylindrales bacterium]|nr:hypothetical protein [Candidatus Limnocylindrales bacterium]